MPAGLEVPYMENAPYSLGGVVDALLGSYEKYPAICKIGVNSQPNRDTVIEILKKLQIVMFPGYFGTTKPKSTTIAYYIGSILEEVDYHLRKQIGKALQHGGVSADEARTRAGRLTEQFMARLPHVREYLDTDVEAAFDGDPAAYSMDEIILCYPGLYAIMVSRIAHELFLLGVPLIPRIMTEHAHTITGVDIHPGATIGKYFFIDHGTGIVIGETTEIGDRVKIYQGVTLGAMSTRGGQSLHHAKRHPTVENDVTIYSGASILGGATVIGEGVVVGSNAFITQSIPSQTKVSVKNPELQMKTSGRETPEKQEFAQEEFWDYQI